jgi:hypothetical protein
MSIWDDPDLKGDDVTYIRLDKQGDGFEGEILSVGTQTFDDGGKVPQLVVRKPDGSEVTWSAGQTQSKRKLAELRPEAGDYIKVTLTQVEKRSGGKTLKHIDIDVREGKGTTHPADRPASGAGAAPSGVDAAAWASMEPDKRAGLMKDMGLVPAGPTENPPF